MLFSASLSLPALTTAFASGGPGSNARTAAYFLSFLGCLGAALTKYPWRVLLHERPLLTLAAPAYSLAALTLTWRLILQFFVAFTQQHATEDDPPNLFVEAYAIVCDMPAGWWWSCTLLCWVTVACPVAHAEAARRGMPATTTLPYITIAFLGAVSHAFPLLLSHLLVLPRRPPAAGGAKASSSSAAPATMPNQSGSPPTPPPRGGASLWLACTVASLLSILALPVSVHSSRPVFIGALIALHTVLAIPFGAQAATGQPVAALSATQLRALACGTAFLHLGASAAAVRDLLPSAISYSSANGGSVVLAIGASLVAAAARNVCQASIALDAVLSTAAGVGFIMASAREPSERRYAAAVVALSPVIGPAAGLALFCAQREEQAAGAQLVDKVKGR